MSHLSETDVFFHCDKELSSKDLAIIKKHLDSCKSCNKLIKEAEVFTGLVCEAAKLPMIMRREKDCLNDMQIAAYLENRVSDQEKEKLEEHLSKCEYCLSILVETKKCILSAVEEEQPRRSHERIMRVVKKKLREKKVETLATKFADLIKKSPVYLRRGLETTAQNLDARLRETFTYPNPCFAPIFGEIQITILSPFGKVRYPILFEWQPYEEVDKYIITIEDIDWSITTTETKFEIMPEDLELEYGQEYMWNLKAMKKDEILEEENGVFSLIDREELKEIEQIESQIEEIEPEEDRLILWGGALEEKELYMDAIQKYKQSYAIQPLSGVAYRIACCYDKLELEDLREEWNKKIPEEV